MQGACAAGWRRRCVQVRADREFMLGEAECAIGFAARVAVYFGDAVTDALGDGRTYSSVEDGNG